MKGDSSMCQTLTYSWPGSDEATVCAQMLKNPASSHWEACYQVIARLTHRAVQREALPASSEQDLVQQVNVAVVKYLPNFHQDCRLIYWLKLIVARMVQEAKKQYIRDQVRQISLDLSESATPALSLAAPGETEAEYLVREQLREVIGSLEAFVATRPPLMRARAGRILRFGLLEDLPRREVAAKLGVSQQVVDNVIFQARRTLRQRFEAIGS